MGDEIMASDIKIYNMDCMEAIPARPRKYQEV